MLHKFFDRNLFLTGPPSTGKSCLIREYVDFCNSLYTMVLAPRRMTASFIQGVLISEMIPVALGPETTVIDFFALLKLVSNEYLDILRHQKVLIIDDIQLVEPVHLLALDYLLQKAHASVEFMGGIRILFSGDLMQYAPPTKLFGIDISISEMVHYWFQFNRIVHLSETYGYEDSYVDFLRRMRFAEVTSEDMMSLFFSQPRPGPCLQIRLDKVHKNLNRTIYDADNLVVLTFNPGMKSQQKSQMNSDNGPELFKKLQMSPKMYATAQLKSEVQVNCTQAYCLRPKISISNQVSRLNRWLLSRWTNTEISEEMELSLNLYSQGQILVYENNQEVEVRDTLFNKKGSCLMNTDILANDTLGRGSLLILLAQRDNHLLVLHNSSVLSLRRSTITVSDLYLYTLRHFQFPVKFLSGVNNLDEPCDRLDDYNGYLTRLHVHDTNLPKNYFYTCLARARSYEYISFTEIPKEFTHSWTQFYKRLYAERTLDGLTVKNIDPEYIMTYVEHSPGPLANLLSQTFPLSTEDDTFFNLFLSLRLAYSRIPEGIQTC